MSWLVLALGSAFAMATADFFVKRGLSDLPLNQVVLVRVCGMIPVSLVILIATPIPDIQPAFWWSCAIALPGEIVAMLLYNRAIQIAPLGVAQPFFATTALFAMLTAFLILGEVPTIMGAAGVVLLSAGAYAVNIHQAKEGWLEPIKAIGRERGALYVLITAVLYAINAVIGKKAILASSPMFMAGTYPLGFAVALYLMLRLRGPIGRQWMSRPVPVVGVSLSMAAMLVLHFWAISMAPAAYMLAVKRTSTLMAVAYGGLFLGEARLAQHLAACLLMVAGGALITLLG